MTAMSMNSPHWQPRSGRGALEAICATLCGSNSTLRAPALAIRVTLLIPGSEPSRLVWTDQHPASVAGCGVLRYKNRAQILDAETFQQLRDTKGARLLTNHRGRVTRALGVPLTEAGIDEENRD